MTNQYKPGDLVNGHRLTEDNRWVPVAGLAASGAAGSLAGPTTAMTATPGPAAPASASTSARELRPSLVKRRWFLPLLVGVLALLVGIGIGGAGKGAPISGSSPLSTVTASAPSPGGGATATVTQPGPTVTQPGPTVTVTASAAPPPADPAANADPSGPKDNNQYLVGKEIAAGNWRCTKGTNLYWKTSTQGGDIVDNGLHVGSGSVIANIRASAYTVDLERCDGTWAKIG